MPNFRGTRYALLSGYTPRGGAPYVFVNSEASDLVARFTTPPTDIRKALIDTLIGSLKTAGVWALVDGFYVLAAADAQAARRNWKQDAFNLTATSSPTFTADRGYTGDGSAAYLDSGAALSTYGGQFVRDSATLAVYVLTNAAEAKSDLGNGSANIRSRTTGSTANTRANDGTLTAVTIPAATAVGFTAWSRGTGPSYEPYKAGAALGTVAVASTAVAASTFVILQAGGGAFSSKQIAFACFGSNLDATKHAALYSAVLTYLQAVGAQ